jgi:hypothetical protein
MYVDAKTRPPNLNHATYIGPIEVRPAGSKGRGLFTTKAVKAGDILLYEKAFTYSFINEEPTNENLAVLVHVDNGHMIMGGQVGLIRMIAQKMFKDPSLAGTITDLHHGIRHIVDISQVDDVPVVDT